MIMHRLAKPRRRLPQDRMPFLSSGYWDQYNAFINAAWWRHYVCSEVFVTSMNEAIIRFLRSQDRGLYMRPAAKVGLLYGVSGVP